MAVHSAMHHAGATALSELLQFPVPGADRRNIPCACGHQAHYRLLRSKPVLTAVGMALSHRSVPRRHRIGHRTHGSLSRGAPYASHRGTGSFLRSRTPADETARRSGGDHQGRGAHGGGDWRRHRRARVADTGKRCCRISTCGPTFWCPPARRE